MVMNCGHIIGSSEIPFYLNFRTEVLFSFFEFLEVKGGGGCYFNEYISFLHAYQPTNSGIVFWRVREWYLDERNSSLKTHF